MDTAKNSNPFLSAWGEALVWHSAQHQAQHLALLAPDLIANHPVQVLALVRALSNTHALRNYILNAVDALVPTVHSSQLHSGMSSLRSSRKGMRMWRHHSLQRALAQGKGVEQEHSVLANARLQLDAWRRSMDVALDALNDANLTQNPTDLSSRLQGEWTQLCADIENERERLTHLRGSVVALNEGVERLRTKAEHFMDVCHAIPSHEDALQSKLLQHMITQLLQRPASGVPETKE